MTTITSSSIQGITSFTQPTDVPNKAYVDLKLNQTLPSQTGNAGEFLTTTDGTTTSWDYVSNYQEFTSTGAQTFTVPNQANMLYIEAIGGGGGGSAGQTTAQAAVTWTFRTSGFSTNAIQSVLYANNTYVAAGNAGTLTTSTDSITWTSRTSGFGTSQILSSLYANNTYYIGGVIGTLTTSTDAITWTQRTSGFGSTSIQVLHYGNNTYVAAGNGAT